MFDVPAGGDSIHMASPSLAGAARRNDCGKGRSKLISP